jgi:hypothetical protein
VAEAAEAVAVLVEDQVAVLLVEDQVEQDQVAHQLVMAAEMVEPVLARRADWEVLDLDLTNISPTLTDTMDTMDTDNTVG